MFTNNNRVQDSNFNSPEVIMPISEQGFKVPISVKFFKQAKGTDVNQLFSTVSDRASYRIQNFCSYHEDKHNLAISWSNDMLN